MSLRMFEQKSPSVLMLLLASTFVSLTPTCANAQDAFAGAVWKFELTNNVDESLQLIGTFRVKKHVMYQKASKTDAEYLRRVGKNSVKKKNKTQFKVTDWKAYSPDLKKEQLLSGEGKLTLVELGQWTGRFTDSGGVNWQMRTTRIKE